MNPSDPYPEGLGLFRVIMIISSLSPLFILWAIRGISWISVYRWTFICATAVIVPYIIILSRILIIKYNQDSTYLEITKFEDSRTHLLVYLLSILLPFYRQDFDGWRDITAVIAALIIIIFVFWHLNLNHVNLLFALVGYRVYTIHPKLDRDTYSGERVLVLLTKRKSLNYVDSIQVFRLSNTVCIELKAPKP